MPESAQAVVEPGRPDPDRQLPLQHQRQEPCISQGAGWRPEIAPSQWPRAGGVQVLRVLEIIPSFEDETEALASFRPQGLLRNVLTA